MTQIDLEKLSDADLSKLQACFPIVANDAASNEVPKLILAEWNRRNQERLAKRAR